LAVESVVFLLIALQIPFSAGFIKALISPEDFSTYLGENGQIAALGLAKTGTAIALLSAFATAQEALLLSIWIPKKEAKLLEWIPTPEFMKIK